MKKILIGTHNKGKFKEIAIYYQKKLKNFHHKNLRSKVPKKQGKLFKKIQN